MNEQIKQIRNKFTDIENKPAVISGEWEGRRGKVGQGLKREERKRATHGTSKLEECAIQHRGDSQAYDNFKWSLIYENGELLCCAHEVNIVNQLYLSKRRC